MQRMVAIGVAGALGMYMLASVRDTPAPGPPRAAPRPPVHGDDGAPSAPHGDEGAVAAARGAKPRREPGRLTIRATASPIAPGYYSLWGECVPGAGLIRLSSVQAQGGTGTTHVPCYEGAWVYHEAYYRAGHPESVHTAEQVKDRATLQLGASTDLFSSEGMPECSQPYLWTPTLTEVFGPLSCHAVSSCANGRPYVYAEAISDGCKPGGAVAPPAPSSTLPLQLRGFGSMTVVCLPVKCSSIIDNGEPLGPGHIFNRPVRSGRHHLVLSAPGCDADVRTVDVPPDQVKEVRAALRCGPGDNRP